MERAIDASELMAEIQVCSWDSEQDRERAEDLVLGMPTLTPPNEPLTIEQLREMDGEAVYIMPMKWWALVDSPKGLKRVILRLKGGGWAAFYSDEDLKNYVEAVYRRLPEGEDK